MELLICIYVIQLGLVFLFLQRVFIQEKTRAKNNLLNFLKQNQEELGFVNQSEFFPLEHYLFIFIPIFGLLIMLVGSDFYKIYQENFECKYHNYLLYSLKAIVENEKYENEFNLIEEILSNDKSPYCKMVTENIIIFASRINEFNSIKNCIEDEQEIINIRNEIKLSLIDFLKFIDFIVNDSKKEIGLYWLNKV
ncbi:TPA: hypothetical protein UL242_002495 [Clostridioides difficile]|uniref:hypothetical protein n=2 Tax=Clostridioides difficile TaxID=1496 RepID=UPI000BB19086|nr:hypothetical protein [Clostridioides difficile]MCW0912293.1 hypothetical protein [Clostridioides difficile]PBF99866.1 hypothetical protein BGV00_06520 [Clostridioides difficile]HEL2860392.1 hypothetical protein [Clostridioides difficile]